MYLGSGGTQWGTSYSKRPLYEAKSKTWTRPSIPTLASRTLPQISNRVPSTPRRPRRLLQQVCSNFEYLLTLLLLDPSHIDNGRTA
jgi:hypothetical protein